MILAWLDGQCANRLKVVPLALEPIGTTWHSETVAVGPSVAQLRLELLTDTAANVAARHGMSRRTLYRRLDGDTVPGEGAVVERRVIVTEDDGSIQRTAITTRVETTAISLEWLSSALFDCVESLRTMGREAKAAGEIENAIAAYSKAGTIAASLTRSAVLMKPKDSENELASATMANIEAEARAMLNEGKNGD